MLRQTFSNLELIVVADGSTDGNREIALGAQAADPRIIYVQHELASGLPALRMNEGIELARGHLCAFQFVGGEWLDSSLGALVECARHAGDATIVFGKASVEGKDGWAHELPDAPVNLLTLSYANLLASNALVAPRALFERYGMYDCHVAMRSHCDWDLWLRLARHVSFLHFEQPVSKGAVTSALDSPKPYRPDALPLSARDPTRPPTYLRAMARLRSGRRADRRGRGAWNVARASRTRPHHAVSAAASECVSADCANPPRNQQITTATCS